MTGIRVLVAGASTRAAAASAARAGFDVVALDAYGDLDQAAGVRSLALPRDFGRRFTPLNAARAARALDVDAVAYLSSFENAPRAVALLARGRRLLGTPPDVLRRVRDPRLLADTLASRGFAVPLVRTAVPPRGDRCGWLWKPQASGGGRGVREWKAAVGSAAASGARRRARAPGAAARSRAPSEAGAFQQRIDGLPGSIIFVAARGRMRPLACTRQLVGDPAFGADGYRYCGTLVSRATFGAPLTTSAYGLATAVADAFGVVGLCGLDFIAAGEVPYPIELNPRWCASMELVERLAGAPLFAAHYAACASGTLPPARRSRAAAAIARHADAADGRRREGADWSRSERAADGVTLGKAIVFARRALVAGDTRPWLEDATVRDVPQPGVHIRQGEPICTVYAEGRDADACHAALIRRAEALYGSVAPWERRRR